MYNHTNNISCEYIVYSTLGTQLGDGNVNTNTDYLYML